MEEGIVINEDSTAEELAPIAKAVNDLLVIPVTARSKNKKGVRVEKGEVIDFEYTGPILERVLKENRVIRTTPLTGRYARIPVVVTPIRNKKGEVIAALGIVDVVGTVDLGAVFADFPRVLEQIKSYPKDKERTKNVEE
ncbi:MAG: DUF2111 domain-containing protein [Methanophagales archaeon]|nr:DUF2111 domain-containing protein [Methanophagales archaeon]